MTWPHLRRSCNSGQSAKWQDRSVFHLQGWACSPPCRRVWGANGNAVERGTERRHWRSVSSLPLLCSCSPAKKTAGSGTFLRFPESELISAQPATRQATYPICPLHDLAIRTQTPGAGRASHGEELNVARASAYSPPDAPTFAQQIDEILSIFRSLGWVRHGGATRISRSR